MRTISQLIEAVKANIKKGVYRPFVKAESKLLRNYYKSKVTLFDSLPPFSLTTVPPDNNNINLYNKSGTLLATGFQRLVVGDYGAYVEIDPSQMVRNSIRNRPSELYRMSDKYKNNVKYFWLESKDDSCTKIYYQTKTVAYADYKVGMCYISHKDLRVAVVPEF